MSGRQILLTLLFVAFCFPVLVDGLSVNYSFVLFPLIVFLIRQRFQRIGMSLLCPLIVYLAVFSISIVLPSVHHDGNYLRQCMSFGIFLTAFSFVFITVTATMIRAFKLAVVLTSIGFCLESVIGYFLHGGQQLHFEAKDLIGQQMLGFMYILAIWITLYHQSDGMLASVAKYCALGILLAGLMLSFSRSAIVALLGSGALFSTAYVLRWLRRPAVVFRGRALGLAAVIVLVTFGVYTWFPITLEFFQVTLFGRNLLQEAASPDDSAGIRIVLWAQMIEYVFQHPVTGSGFLGVWILPNLPYEVGSAHNQYMDVLFRSGIPGFFAYCWLLCLVLRHLYRYERGMFWGMTGMIIFGMFHETFKESEGAFILAFWLGMVAESSRSTLRKLTMPAFDEGTVPIGSPTLPTA